MKILDEQIILNSRMIADLEKFYSTAILPKTPFKLYDYAIINNVKLFVSSELISSKYLADKAEFIPSMVRLLDLKCYLETTKI